MQEYDRRSPVAETFNMNAAGPNGNSQQISVDGTVLSECGE